MLQSVHEIYGYKIQASDGHLGKVKDLLFDDKSWTVRYIVVDTGGWLTGRQVLISPVEVGRPQWETKIVPVSLTRQQIADSPDIQADLPVSRQHELQLVHYYGWLPYWAPPPAELMAGMEPSVATVEAPAEDRPHGDPHLRSTREIEHYHIHAADGEIGHVATFIADTEGWILRYLVVDLRNWLPGKKVLVAPNWITKIDWSCSTVHIDLLREQIRSSPEFDPAAPVNREYEMRLYDYYGRPKYWVEGAHRKRGL